MNLGGRESRAFWGVDNSERVAIKGELRSRKKALRNFAPAFPRFRHIFING